ncbi:MAG: hypothetical protein ACI8XZ_004996 [Gammaproteobacteria bacterium]|jgi:hypothetical protein
MPDLARGGDQFEGRKRVANNGPLILTVKRPPNAMPQGVVNKQSTWRSPSLQNIERTADRDCCNAMCFKISCYQTPGLMAHGSHRDQQDRIYRLRLEFGA